MVWGGLQLAACALLFGSTFLVMKQAVAEVQPLTFLALRFGFAALVLWPLARRRPRTPGELRHGLLAGVALLCGYVLQVTGLRHTSSTRSAFITYLLIVLVPLMEAVVLRRRLRASTAIGVIVALVGLVLLVGPGEGAGGGFGLGEVLTLLCAFAFGAHIVILDRYAHLHDPMRLTQVQLLVVTGCCAVGATVSGVGPARRGLRVGGDHLHRCAGDRGGIRADGLGSTRGPRHRGWRSSCCSSRSVPPRWGSWRVIAWVAEALRAPPSSSLRSSSRRGADVRTPTRPPRRA